jgi:aldose 1-epimerase
MTPTAATVETSRSDDARARRSLYTLAQPGGLHVAITDFGGAIVSLWAPDRDGAFADVVLGYETFDGYLAGKSFFGRIIGRYGNRIARGRFTLDGVEYSLTLNDCENHLHGGRNGFDRVAARRTGTGSFAETFTHQ